MKCWMWIVQNWELICLWFGIAVNAAGLGYQVFKCVHGDKARRAGQLTRLFEAAREFEVEAEHYTGYSGAEKLCYVLSRLRTLAAEMGCPFDEEVMRARITEDIAFTKAVNAEKSATLE